MFNLWITDMALMSKDGIKDHTWLFVRSTHCENKQWQRWNCL